MYLILVTSTSPLNSIHRLAYTHAMAVSPHVISIQSYDVSVRNPCCYKKSYM